MGKKARRNIVLSAMFLSIGFVLPFLTGQIKEIGDTLLPMHIPVMLCGFICGARNAALVGLILPVLRSIVFSMPPFYPNAVSMALELATYGLVVGIMYFRFKSKSLKSVYISLIAAMLVGRVIWGISKAVLLGFSGKAFSFSLFIMGGFVDALPGIILQLILIPLIMQVINKRKI